MEDSVKVPLIAPRRVGVKVTVISQVAPIATVPPQLSVIGKSAGSSSLMLLIVSAAVPELLTVTVCGVEALPIVSEPKFSVVLGAKLALAWPLPTTVNAACEGANSPPIG